ncbi:MAG: RnfABCDGE type electron transport complex subunit E [Ruminococcaceae bacterium]|nr:RnfABCDGE type electron transport complex subunit E [Oscillospiraceae bacterium]
MNENKFDIKKHFFSSLFDQNPILVQLLGTCPTLATSKTMIDGIGMGLSATAVLILSNLLISLLRKFIPKQVRIAAYIVIISGFVTAVELLIKAYLPSLNESLGIFIPLIVVNCIILARAEAFASKNKPIPSMIDGLFMGIGFTFALGLLGMIREFLGTGALLGKTIIKGYPENGFITGNAGAFLALGCLIAAVSFILSVAKNKKGGNK